MPDDVTELLQRFRTGDKQAEAQLLESLHSELKRLARRYLSGERQGHTLQPTALVNEAYMKLIDVKAHEWRDRVHFIAVAARVMRQILVDHARRRRADKRGGGVDALPIIETIVPAAPKSEDLIDLDEALQRLEKKDPRAFRIVELRYFGGLSIEETAEVLGVSPRTVKRDWMLGRSWLRGEIRKAR